MLKIDIVMATYNGEKYINEQIDSIINQTFTNWNLIIRDDGSKDGTVNIIKEYEKKDKRIRLIEDNLGNLGYNKNFEKLLTHSMADYIMFCDQDDIWNKNKVEISFNEIKKITKNDVPALVFSNSEIFMTEEKKGKLHIENKNVTDGNILMGENICQGATMIVTKNIKNFIIPFDENFTFDYFILLKMVLEGKWSFIKNPLMKYRIHQNNQIGIKCVEKFNLRREWMYLKLYKNQILKNIDLILKTKKNKNNGNQEDLIKIFFSKNRLQMFLEFMKRKEYRILRNPTNKLFYIYILFAKWRQL